MFALIAFLLTFLKPALAAYFIVRLMKFLFVISKSFLVHFVMPEYDLTPLKEGWTVVTGGTDGIGRAYIEELAKTRGIKKFYLLGRNPKKLNNVADHLTKTYGATVETKVFDFEKDDLDTLPEELKTMDVGILINCVGIAPAGVGNFAELEPGLPSKILKVNLMSTIKMIELILPGMLKRNKGIIVNMASMTGWRPLPYISTYPASKAALSFYSDALSDEFHHTNVRIQCLIPLLVATKIAAYDRHEANDLFVVSTESFARQAVHAIGRWDLITGCIQHDLHIAFGALMSFWLFKQIFVPLVMLGVHKKRVEVYYDNHKDE